MSKTKPSFARSTLNYQENDPKFTAFGEGKPKKMKMSESFLAAKAKCSPNSFNNTFLTDTTLPAKLDIFETPPPSTKTNKESGRFVCKTDGCFQTFHSRKDLRRHKLIHRVRKHVCPINGCGRAFFEKSKLKRHMVVHTKRKEYACKICGKKFGYKANVKTHMRTHTGERPFKCRIKGCVKTFAQASNRNAHEKTHFKTEEEKEMLKYSQLTETKNRKRKMSEDVPILPVRRSSRLQSKEGAMLVELPKLDLLDEALALEPAPVKVEALSSTRSLSKEEVVIDFEDLAADIGNMAPLSQAKDSGNNLFSEPPPNLLFNSFTSFHSSIFESKPAKGLGLNIDNLDDDLLNFVSTNSDSKKGANMKPLRTPSKLNSRDLTSEFGFDSKLTESNKTMSFLSTHKIE